MKTIYIYLLDSMAEWEIGNILQAVSMEKAVRKEEPEYQVKTFGLTRNPVKTIGGLRLIPDLSIDEIIEEDMVALLLPGGETWSDKMHDEVLDKAEETLKKGTVVGAICGATLAIAERGYSINISIPVILLIICPTFQKHIKVTVTMWTHWQFLIKIL